MARYLYCPLVHCAFCEHAPQRLAPRYSLDCLDIWRSYWPPRLQPWESFFCSIGRCLGQLRHLPEFRRCGGWPPPSRLWFAAEKFRIVAGKRGHEYTGGLTSTHAHCKSAHEALDG